MATNPTAQTTSLVDQIRSAGWGGEWNAGGVDRYSELARMLENAGVSNLGQLSLNTRTADPAVAARAAANRRNAMGNDRGGFRALMANANLDQGGTQLMIGDRALGFLGDSNNDGSIRSVNGQYLGDNNMLAWSAQGDGNVGYHAQRDPVTGQVQIVPSWGSSSDMDDIRGALQIAGFAGGAIAGGNALAGMAESGAAAGAGAGAGAGPAGGLTAGELGLGATFGDAGLAGGAGLGGTAGSSVTGSSFLTGGVGTAGLEGLGYAGYAMPGALSSAGGSAVSGTLDDIMAGQDATASFPQAGNEAADFGLTNASAEVPTAAASQQTTTPALLESQVGTPGYGASSAGAGGGSGMGFWDSLLSNVGSGAASIGSNILNSGGNALGQMGAAALIQRMFGPNAPSTPDFNQVAQQQGQQNLEAAQINNQMNRVDTTTPYGSQTFGRVADPNAPGGFRYTSNIAFSPEQQRLYESQTRGQQATADMGNSMLGRIGESVATPFNIADAGQAQRLSSDPNQFSAERDQITQALYDRLTRLRRPQMEQDMDRLDLRLRNQGLMPGTQAYDRGMRSLLDAQGAEMANFTDRAVEAGGAEQSRLQQEIRANAGFNNNTRSQTIQEMLLQRQQPLAEYNAFRTGTSPTLPQFQAYGQAQTQPANLMGGAQAQYGVGVDNYNRRIGELQQLLNLGSGALLPSYGQTFGG